MDGGRNGAKYPAMCMMPSELSDRELVDPVNSVKLKKFWSRGR